MNESTWTFALRRRIEVQGSITAGLSPDGKDIRVVDGVEVDFCKTCFFLEK